MDKRDFFVFLSESLEGYSTGDFRFHGRFFEEFKVLLKKASGNEREIFNLLIKQLNFVKALGERVDQVDSNEIIKYQERNYYSLHLRGRNFNLRLLITFDEESIPIFLAAFYERSGKRASDYTLWKQVLKRRYSEM